MKRIGIIAGLSAALALATSAALAQSAAAPTPPPAQSFNLQVTPADLALIAKTLGKAPYEEAAPVFQKLQSQVSAQAQKPPAPAPVAEPTATPNPTNGRPKTIGAAEAGKPAPVVKEGPKTVPPAPTPSPALPAAK